MLSFFGCPGNIQFCTLHSLSEKVLYDMVVLLFKQIYRNRVSAKPFYCSFTFSFFLLLFTFTFFFYFSVVSFTNMIKNHNNVMIGCLMAGR